MLSFHLLLFVSVNPASIPFLLLQRRPTRMRCSPTHAQRSSTPTWALWCYSWRSWELMTWCTLTSWTHQVQSVCIIFSFSIEMNLSTSVKLSLLWTADSNESQNVVHFVTLPEKWGSDNLGSFIITLLPRGGAEEVVGACVSAISVRGLGVGFKTLSIMVKVHYTFSLFLSACSISFSSPSSGVSSTISKSNNFNVSSLSWRLSLSWESLLRERPRQCQFGWAGE